MSKIGILTYHTGYNYGASLQAFALQKTIKKYGKNVEIINFETERFIASREMFSRKPTRIKELAKIASRLPYWSELHKRQAMFDAYTKECLPISQLYRTEKEVIEHAYEYDCIVCGSDQIWNLSQLDAPAANPLFFLNFPKTQRRVSYAASFGKWVSEAHLHEDVFLPWLKQFDMISVREDSGVEYVRSKGLDCQIALDPTLLLDPVDYDEICRNRLVDKKYILMFGWNTNDDLILAAKKASKKLNLPIINIVPPPRGMFCGIERKLDVGPREFLSMIKHAEFVVTNSFHGTVFSTNYHKPYVSIVSGKADTRMASILGQLGMSKHLTSAQDFDPSNYFDTDFDLVHKKLTALRQNSLDYLKKAIEV